MDEVMQGFYVGDEEFVLVRKKTYDKLVERDDWLMCLEAAGVDNWEGYDVARQIQQGEVY